MELDIEQEMLRHAEKIANFIPNAIEELRFKYVDNTQTMTYSITKKRKFESGNSLGTSNMVISGEIVTYLDINKHRLVTPISSILPSESTSSVNVNTEPNNTSSSKSQVNQSILVKNSRNSFTTGMKEDEVDDDDDDNDNNYKDNDHDMRTLRMETISKNIEVNTREVNVEGENSIHFTKHMDEEKNEMENTNHLLLHDENAKRKEIEFTSPNKPPSSLLVHITPYSPDHSSISDKDMDDSPMNSINGNREDINFDSMKDKIDWIRWSSFPVYLRQLIKVWNIPCYNKIQSSQKIGKIVYWVKDIYRRDDNYTLETVLTLSKLWNIPVIAMMTTNGSVVADTEDLAFDISSHRNPSDILSISQQSFCRKSLQRVSSIVEMSTILEELNIPSVVLRMDSNSNNNNSTINTMTGTISKSPSPQHSKNVMDTRNIKLHGAISTFQSWIPGGIYALVTDYDNPISDSLLLQRLSKDLDTVILSVNNNDMNIMDSNSDISTSDQRPNLFDDYDKLQSLKELMDMIEKRDKSFPCLTNLRKSNNSNNNNDNSHNHHNYDLLQSSSERIFLYPIRQELQLKVCGFSDLVPSTNGSIQVNNQNNSNNNNSNSSPNRTVINSLKITSIKLKGSRLSTPTMKTGQFSYSEISLTYLQDILCSISQCPFEDFYHIMMASTSIQSRQLSQSRMNKQRMNECHDGQNYSFDAIIRSIYANSMSPNQIISVILSSASTFNHTSEKQEQKRLCHSIINCIHYRYHLSLSMFQQIASNENSFPSSSWLHYLVILPAYILAWIENLNITLHVKDLITPIQLRSANTNDEIFNRIQRDLIDKGIISTMEEWKYWIAYFIGQFPSPRMAIEVAFKEYVTHSIEDNEYVEKQLGVIIIVLSEVITAFRITSLAVSKISTFSSVYDLTPTSTNPSNEIKISSKEVKEVLEYFKSSIKSMENNK